MNKTTAYIIVYVFTAVHASIMLSAADGDIRIFIIIFYILFCIGMKFSIAEYFKKKEEFEAKQEKKEQKQQDQQQNGYWYRDHYGRKRWQSTEQQQQTQHRTTNFALMDAYMTLGVVEGESDEEIKEAYKRLVKKWHPDRFVQEGEAAIHRAEEKTKEINKAYDLICQYRGMK